MEIAQWSLVQPWKRRCLQNWKAIRWSFFPSSIETSEKKSIELGNVNIDFVESFHPKIGCFEFV